MKKTLYSRGICEKALFFQMSRNSRKTNLRHPYLAELDSRFYESLEFINFQPKNVFSIDAFPVVGKGLKKSFFKGANWSEGSFLPIEFNNPVKSDFFSGFTSNLFSFIKKKQILYPSINNHYSLADNSFDYIQALAAIPWVDDMVCFVNEIYRLLDSGGLFGFASFGPETLNSLVLSLEKENDSSIKKSFIPLIDLHDIGDFCISAGFVSPIVASNRVSFKYKKAETALKELRMLSGNPCSNRDIFLRGKNWYKTIINALNNCRDSSGYVTLEFELIYGHAWKANGVDKKISENKAKGSSKIIEKEIKFK